MFACLLGMFVLVGCNTVGGFGKDVQKAGQGVSHAADKASHEIKKAVK
nr:entericidin A/B family lipoprotein [Dichelobacter nodosus]